MREDLTDHSCGYAAVTEERGILWQSKTIDCPFAGRAMAAGSSVERRAAVDVDGLPDDGARLV